MMCFRLEFPSRLNPSGQKSDLSGILKRSEQGLKVLTKQMYQIESEIVCADRVAIEAQWSGILSVPVGTLPAGAEMRAHLAIFYEMKDGKIVVQRNYDCFEPW
jgi:predicted ester cyclase